MQATIRIKNYDGVEQLALGRRSVVFGARSRRHKCPVVIKVLLPHLAGDSRFVARFTRDVREAAGLTHENLVGILDFGRTESSYYVVTERYQGTPLSEVLAEHPRVPVPIALSIVLQVACALEAVHARGLVHRDVRPGNIIVSADGSVRLANLALATDIGEKGRVTHAGKVTATPAYMSPEQTRGEELGPPSDVFSLGCLAYELLAGERAFGRGDFGEIVERIQSGPAPPPEDANPLLESRFARIVARMLAPDAGERYAHVSELVMDLEEAMDRYGHGRDDAETVAWVTDPGDFSDAYARSLLERLAARRPAGGGALLRYYEKVVFLDPGDEGARNEVARLRRDVPKAANPASAGRGRPAAVVADDSPAVRFGSLDPGAEYRVILESIDTARVNKGSFALMLSMKLRTPLPRITALVRSMPSRVMERATYRQAMLVAKSIEELGGRVRLDICGKGASERATDRPGARPSPASAAGCPRCGQPVTADAAFCPMCLERLAAERLDARVLRERGVAEDNPLAETATGQRFSVRSARRLFAGWLESGLDRILALPTPAKVIGGIVLAGVLLRLLAG